MISMTRPSCVDGPEEGIRPLKTPRTWITYGQLPLRIMSISRSKDVLDLCVFVCIMRNSRRLVIAAIRNFLYPLFYPSSWWSSLMATSQHHLWCLALNTCPKPPESITFQSVRLESSINVGAGRLDSAIAHWGRKVFMTVKPFQA